MSENTLQDRLLEHVQRPNYRPVKPKVIAKKLELSEEQVPEFRRALRKLIRQGRLAYGDKHLVKPGSSATATKQVAAVPEESSTPPVDDTPRQEKPKPSQKSAPKLGADRIIGTFRRKEKGFGFVRPRGALPGGLPQQDLYVAGDMAGDASTGDVVLVRIVDRGRGGLGPRGAIVEVLERDTHKFVGTYFERAGSSYVQIDGTMFSQPIFVGDPGAKNAQPDDKVVIEMVRFPSHMRTGEGVIVEVLGKRGETGVDTLSIIHEYGLPGIFPEDVLENAREEAERFVEEVPEGRLDLTAKTIITIDPIDARDFDDAISLERIASGGWRLGVHIADVSHFVKPKTPLDREAYERATSIYLPDNVIPMLPEIISNGLASLQPDRIRYTKTCFIEFSAEGLPLHTEVHNSAIKSCRRFAYEEVDEYLADREAWREKLTPVVHALLADMHELAMLLRRRRMERGSLELTMQEVKVDLDPHGRVTGAHRVVNTESHQMIEEFMLAANEAVAEKIHAQSWPFLRRIHQTPDPRKLKALTEFINSLGIATESLESRFELQRVLRAVEGLPEQHAVNYAVLRSMQRAVYGPAVEGHYALASDCYCHFTSPIRRYPDLTVHRLIDTLLSHRKPHQDFDTLVISGEHCSEREQRAQSAERDLTKLKLLNYLAGRIGEQMDAVVTGVEEYGLFAMGVELPAEGLIPVTTLADDYYRYDGRTHTLSGHRSGNTFRLGDRIRVEVARVELDRRELDFRIVGIQQRAPRVTKPGEAETETPHRKRPKQTTTPRNKKNTPPTKKKPRR
jgi:ribonuclease R